MSEQDLVAKTLKVYEVLNKRDMAGFAARMAPNCAVRVIGRPEVRTREDYLQYASNVFTAFPDGQLTVEDVVVSGNKSVSRYTFRATHTGELMGIPPTGKKVALEGIVIIRDVEGITVEFLEMIDGLGMYQQLGLMPTPGQAQK